MYYDLISSMRRAPASTFDPDAQAFITATGITDTTQQNAINTLVVDFKTFGIWNKMKAIYPMVGGTAIRHQYNLKDARDLDIAFRLSFIGGWTHSATGALPNGTTGYADTFLNSATVIANANDGHLSYYSRTNNSGTNQIEIGNRDSNSSFDLVIKFGGGNLAGACINMSDTNVFTNNTTSTGLYHANQNNTANVRKMFKNGSVLATQNVAQNLQPSEKVYIGARGGISSGFFSSRECAFASIGNGLTDTESFNFNAIVQAFQINLNRQIIDADAQAFITAAAITNQTQINAVNQLVSDLKTYDIWSKMKAIYPMVGGTATTHKFNLKDPRDLNAAFRLSFFGGWVHSSTGAKPNGSTGYADTFLTESTTLNANDEHISIYSRTNIIGLYCDIGTASGASSPQSNIYPNYSGNFYPRIQAPNNGTGQNLNTAAMFVSNRVISTEVQGWRNTTKYTLASSSVGRSTATFWLGNMNLNGSSAGVPSNRELAFATIGDGLTDTEVSNFYTAVQAFQTTLSRQVT